MQLAEVAEYWEQILKLNEFQCRRFCDNIVDTMVTVKGKKIAILGFAYKPNTSDTRESPAIAICNSLISEGCKVSICDPQVSLEQILACLDNPSPLLIHKANCPLDAMKGKSVSRPLMPFVCVCILLPEFVWAFLVKLLLPQKAYSPSVVVSIECDR